MTNPPNSTMEIMVAALQIKKEAEWKSKPMEEVLKEAERRQRDSLPPFPLSTELLASWDSSGDIGTPRFLSTPRIDPVVRPIVKDQGMLTDRR